MASLNEPWAIRITARRSRRILIACLITLLISLVLIGLISMIRWGGRSALKGDTHAVALQAGEQLIRSLNSRRGTLTFIRDVLERRGDLSSQQLKALGASATEHTRHLLGAGLVGSNGSLEWWDGPSNLTRQERAALHSAVTKRLKLRGAWRVPSTFTDDLENDHLVLVMLEPFESPSGRRQAVIGALDFKPLLQDFFDTRLTPRHPVQMFDATEATLLYQSPDWVPATAERKPIVVDQLVDIDSARWKIELQPGSTRVRQTLSWFNVLLIGLSMLAGLGITIIVWILAARTWILERAVQRRTEALRRTSERLRQLATTDELTGLYNRRFFLDRWNWEHERARRYGRPLACLMIDVNDFKLVNDRLGHLVGDAVLKDVANELKAAMRQADILARFGGDEFIIALPETSQDQAEAVAEKLRQVKVVPPDIAGHPVPPVRLSVGVGIAEAQATAQDIIQAADQALYDSKHQSRRQRASSHASQ